MKHKYLSSLSLGLILFTLSGSAQAASDQLGIAQDNNYVTSADIRLLPSSGGDQASILPAGTDITVLETKQDPRLGTLVHLGIDSDDASLPADAWVSMNEFTLAGIDKAMEGDLEEVAAFNEAENNGGLFTDARARKRKMTYCFRYVKQYLLKIGKVKTYLPGASAWMAAGELPKHGFHRIAGGPATAQINDVCVYRGGNGGHGHVEVRIKGGWYYGYGTKPNPISKHNHPFIGCFRK